MFGYAQAHPLPVWGIHDFKQTIGQLPVHAERVWCMTMPMAFACAN